MAEKRGGGGPTEDEDLGDAADEALDQLWERIREQLTDAIVPADSKRIPGQDPSTSSTRLRFTRSCEVYDRNKSGIIKFSDLQSAFVAAKITPPPTLA